ncbi:MAG: hypothetical protein ABIN80_11860 [Dyadobacter sp.]|uniref:hypothetical protein n=1 Tax=Dyadobacter sp. TaxID=1914288 RepID=UPI00326527B1
MPPTKEKSQKASKELIGKVTPDDSFPEINEALFARLAEDPFFKEKNRRMTEILEKVDWTGFHEKSKQ